MNNCPGLHRDLYNVRMSDCRDLAKAITRRQLAQLTAALPLAAQVTSTVPPQGAPAPAAPPATPQERLQKAYADVRKVSDQLAKLEVPASLEPAFAFRP